MKSLAVVFFVLLSNLLIAQNEVYIAPKKVIKNCNAMVAMSLHDTVDRTLYFYFEKAELDTLQYYDSVTYVDENCQSIDSVAGRDYYRLKKGKIYLVDESGFLLNKTAFDDIILYQPFMSIVTFEDINCMIECFQGYDLIIDWRVKAVFNYNAGQEFMPVFCNVPLINSSINPFIVKVKGKWGLMDTNGIMLTEIDYDEIKKNDNGKYELYNNGILIKIIDLNK